MDTTTFYLTITHHQDVPQSVRAVAYVPTLEDAQAIAAVFPKWVNVKASHTTAPDGECGAVVFVAGLLADGVNGGINETGLRRFRAFEAKAAAAGIAVMYAGPGVKAPTPIGDIYVGAGDSYANRSASGF